MSTVLAHSPVLYDGDLTPIQRRALATADSFEELEKVNRATDPSRRGSLDNFSSRSFAGENVQTPNNYPACEYMHTCTSILETAVTCSFDNSEKS